MATKIPLSQPEIIALENVLNKKCADGNRLKDYEAIKLMLYTGCHPSVLIDQKRIYALREEVTDGGPLIIWNRPKKKGREARCQIIRSRHIEFDVNEYMSNFRKRRGGKKSRQYLYDLVKRTCESAGISGASPMTLRHTAGVQMLKMGMRRSQVMDILNVSEKTLKTYLKFTPKENMDDLKRIGW